MNPSFDQHLFKADLHTYAVLDGASVPDLPVRLHEMQPPSLCLYRGELEPDLLYTAPYLVHVLPETPFAKWLLNESWGKHWGIFAQSARSLVGMRKHFRSFLIVNESSGNPLLFRFYDPRVLLTFLPTCNGHELTGFFGRISYYFAESEETNSLRRFHFAGNELHETDFQAAGSQTTATAVQQINQ